MTSLLNKKLLLIGSVALAITIVAVASRWIPGATGTTATRFKLDVSAPDAVILSRNLAELPRDLLAVPLLRDTLTEDVVFYYEQNEERLSLSGTLKRLAFEHEVSLSDELVGSLLQQPAEVALWKGQGGRLDHWLLAVRRGGAARLAEAALKIAGSDEQLQKAGSIELAEGELDVFVLHYARDRHLYFTARGDRLLAATDPQLLVGTPDESSAQRKRRLELVTDLIKPDPAANPYVRQFRLQPGLAQHSVTVTTRYLSFGYGQLFRGVNALRFEFGQGKWSTWGQIDGTRIQPKQLNVRSQWQLMPGGAALCSSAPLNWEQVRGTLSELTDDEAAAERFAAGLDPAVAVCWYPSGHYYAPLFVATGRSAEWDNAWLGRLFDAFVTGAPDDNGTPVKTAGGTTQWQRDGQPAVTLARRGNALLFSIDGALVQKALAVADKRYPALADSLPPGRNVALYAQPRQLAALLKGDLMATLPQESEPVFFEAASKHLLPRLKTLSGWGAFVLTYPDRLQTPSGWEPLAWQALPR